MILTCPECSTQYVVKDGAIPPEGRKVRCASCKHSWHQSPDRVEDIPEVAGDDRQGALDEQTMPDGEQSAGDRAAAFHDEAGTIAGPDVDAPSGGSDDWPRDDESGPVAASFAIPSSDQGASPAIEAPVAEYPEQSADEPPVVDDDFGSFDGDDEPAPRRKWPILVLGIVLLALAGAAFWISASPDLKQRVGIAQSGGSPLYVVELTHSRQKLESGNDLFMVSGKVVNPTDEQQAVPSLRAELLDETRKTIIYQWIIDPPATRLGPNASASFNSAEMGVPESGRFLRVRVGAAG